MSYRDFVNHQNDELLLTDHLNDVDMELELLKRKRELLLQKQNMISRISRQNYEQPFSSFRQMNYECIQYQPDFFEPQPRNFHQGLKRPNQSDWQTSNAKRFNSEYINPRQNEVNQPKTQYQQPNQRLSSTQQMSAKPGIGQRLKRDNKNPARDFQPTKITKNHPKARPKPAIVSHITNEAMNLVSEAKTSQPNDRILMADRQPTLQMKGRMELALGSILKELRQELINDPGVSEYFATLYIQRIVKLTIRSRIRDVMMGKVIGTANDIIKKYRKAYPKETDVEILTTVKKAEALGSKNLNVTHLIQSDDPQDFFKRNMTWILSNKLDGLFSNLQQFHENKDAQIIEGINKLPEPRTSGTNQVDSNEKMGLQQIFNNSFESGRDDNDPIKALGGRIEKAKHYIDFMENLIEEMLPKVLPKFKDVIINMLLHDRVFIGAKSMVMADVKKKVIERNETELKKDDKIIGDQEAKKDDISMKRVKVLPFDETLTAEDIGEKEHLYCVKLIGRPKLPSREVIYEFLKKYNTKTIKKHKTINNLLVLTFTNKTDYDMILTASETVIGDITIIIKASEKVVMKKDTNQKTSQKKDESQNSCDKKNLISASNDTDGPVSLDDQTGNLLSIMGKADKEMVVSSCGNDKQNNDNTVTSDKPVEDDDNISESNNNVEGNDIITENNDTMECNDKIADNNDIIKGNEKKSENKDKMKDKGAVTDKINEGNTKPHIDKDNIKNNDVSKENVKFKQSGDSMTSEEVSTVDTVIKNEMDSEDEDKLREENKKNIRILNMYNKLRKEAEERNDKIAENNNIIEGNEKNSENNDIIESNEKNSENKDKIKDKGKVTDKMNERSTKSHIDKDNINNNDVSKENVKVKLSGDSMTSEEVSTMDKVIKNEMDSEDEDKLREENIKNLRILNMYNKLRKEAEERNGKIAENNNIIEGNEKNSENNDIIEGNEKNSENKDKMKDKGEVTDKINEGNTKSHIDKDNIKNNDVSKENVKFKQSGDSMTSEEVSTVDTVIKNELDREDEDKLREENIKNLRILNMYNKLRKEAEERNDKIAENNNIIEGNEKNSENNDIIEGNEKKSENKDKMKDKGEVTDKINEGNTKSHIDKDNIKNNDVSKENVKFKQSGDSMTSEEVSTVDTVIKNEMDREDEDKLREENEINNEKLDKFKELKKQSGKYTPFRFSSRLASTPSGIRKRGNSRLTKNN